MKFTIEQTETGRWIVRVEGYSISLSGPNGCADLETACKLIRDFESVMNS